MRRPILFIALLMPMLSWACDCANWPLDSAIANANVVFVGKCMDFLTNPIKGDYNVVFQVDSSWKRPIEHMATVHTPSNSCGLNFKVGETYLVLGMKKRQTLHTNACDYTRPFKADLPPQVRALGKAILPGRPEYARGMNYILIGLGVGGLLFILFVVMRKRIFPPRK